MHSGEYRLLCVWSVCVHAWEREREREMATNRESQGVKLCANVSNILDWSSGGFSVYCADVLMVPAGIDTTKMTTCVLWLCLRVGLVFHNAYACKFVSVWDGRVGVSLWDWCSHEERQQGGNTQPQSDQRGESCLSWLGTRTDTHALIQKAQRCTDWQTDTH